MKILVGIVVVLALLVLSGALGTLMSRDAGFVLLSYGGHEISTSLWFALLVGVGVYLLARVLISLLASVLSSGQLFGRWNARRRRLGARRQTEQGLLLMAEEEWAEARSSLVSGAKNASAPMLNFLQAAYASNELGQTKRRDELLKRAADSTPGAQFAVDLAAARMQVVSSDKAEVVAAIETLKGLRDQAPRHQIVTEFLARAHEANGDYSALESELGKLKRMRKEHPEEVARMELGIARHKVLDAFAKDGDAAGAVAVWQRQDKATRLDDSFVRDLTAALAGSGAYLQAGEVFANALDDRWSSEWLALYADLPEIEAAQAGKTTSWLKVHGSDAGVQLLAARAAARDGNWPKAREHAQKSEELRASAAARVELARCEQALGSTADDQSASAAAG